jgi:hypothetical protein
MKYSIILYFEKKMGRGLVAPEGITISNMKKKILKKNIVIKLNLEYN